MTNIFTHRYAENGAEAPLKKGKHLMVMDTYECERAPRIGESGEDYARYAVQCGKLLRTTKETYIVE